MQFLEDLPQEILSWQLKGTGLDNLGTKGRPDTVPFPRYTEDDLIARIDAVGLCFSDIKLISAGASHPRIEGRNLAKSPTVPGHEVAMTIVGVGEKWKDKFTLGSRYIIQADIYYKGKGIAFGYAIPGGLSQYAVIGTEILEGDEGCYLLPVRKETGFAEAALVEPWTCVIASYQIRARLGVKPNGRVQFAGFQKGQVSLDLGGLDGGRISQIIHSGLSPQNTRAVEELARKTGAVLVPPGQAPEAGEGPADIICAGTPDRESFLRLANSLQTDGAIGIHTSEPEVELPVDVGKVHYRRMELLGSMDGRVADSYRANSREALVAGGRAWFVGGAGPMGQMHVIKAVMDEHGPSDVLVTDLSDERLTSLKHLLSILGSRNKRKVTLTFENPKDLPSEELDTFLTGKYPGGFDDVVVLVPVQAIITQASHYLAPTGVLNIFAGVKLGTITDLPFGPIVRDKVRVIGSSGSPLSAMRDTLALTESGGLSTSYSLAAIGDMGSASKGMKALMDNTFTGKVVIFPFAHGIGLKSIRDLARDLPEIAPLLLDGQYWTREAEAEFFKSRAFKEKT
jgi:L-sorbose 1-phosphate reductase